MKKRTIKKLLIYIISCLILSSPCFASCNTENDCDKNTCQTQSHCGKSIIDDDEYCIYNQCYFDKHYVKMKKAVCPTRQQEAQMDIIYKNFKADMENFHSQYRTEKNKLLTMIECDNDCYKAQKNKLKEMQKTAKEKLKCFRDDIKDQLCKNQYSDFRKFQRQEKRKMKKIVKYGALVKLPCSDCCK